MWCINVVLWLGFITLPLVLRLSSPANPARAVAQQRADGGSTHGSPSLHKQPLAVAPFLGSTPSAAGSGADPLVI